MPCGKKKRYVYGTRTKKWYLVGPEDRDFTHGIEPITFKKIGKKKAKNLYLMPRLIR